MATKVHMEALSPTMEEGQLVKWLKQEGDAVKEGDVLAEIETDKAIMELVARGSGVLQGVRLQEGTTAPVGEVIAYILAEGEAAPAADGAPKTGAAAPKDEEPADEEPEGEEPKGEAPAGKDAEAGQGGKKQDADVARGRREVAKTGGTQTPGDEATLDEAQERPREEKDAGAREPAAAPAPARAEARGGDGRVKASPLARRLANEAGIELETVEGTGPGGRITKRDIEAAQAAAPAGRGSGPGREGPDSEEVPVSQMRKAIAKRLVTSIGPVPTFYLTIEIDAQRLVEARERVNERLEKQGLKASINDYLIRALAQALVKHPEVNASWEETVIRRHRRVHVGVAVAIDEGLITPVIRDADRKQVTEIAAEVKELAGRAREKKLKPEEYTGATFSISNLGMFGIQEFTAIINPPEAGIIAVGAVEEKVVVENGQPVVRPRMRLTMSCDHRVIDGAMGAKFLQTLRDYLEEPVMIIA